MSKTNLWDYLSDVAEERTDRIEARQEGRSDRKETKEENETDRTESRQTALTDRAGIRGSGGALFGQVATAIGPEIAQIGASTIAGLVAAQTGSPAAAGTALDGLLGLAGGATEEAAPAPAPVPAPEYKDTGAKSAAPMDYTPWLLGGALGLGLLYAASRGRGR